ncbi:MAG: hypothetical protein ACK41V_05475 [Acidovorax sp.]|uniref:hypothetical protein n=1 Tax=Acidovorax sp. TaxID=1872122 RepID=UPI00391D3060
MRRDHRRTRLSQSSQLHSHEVEAALRGPVATYFFPMNASNQRPKTLVNGEHPHVKGNDLSNTD